MASKKQNAITKVTPGGALALPAYLQNVPAVGTEKLRDYFVVPRLKIVQKQADKVYLDQFMVGDLILVPMNQMVNPIRADEKGRNSRLESDVFHFTPIFFFEEWITLSPIILKGKEPAVLYRTNDPNDPIVAKARSKQLRVEPHPGHPAASKLTVRHVEVLNFICVLHGVEGVTDPVIMTFSKGEHFTGSKFCSLIGQRNASLYDCVFEGRTKYRPGKGVGDWYGLDVTNPTQEGVSPWVSEAEHAQFADDHLRYVKIHESKGIRPSDDVDENADDPSEGGGGRATAGSVATAGARF